MELKPGSKHNMLAMTGVITSTTEKNSLITILQDMEYIHGQLFERSVESGCGAVTCLPGALTILRFSAFRKMSKYYFADKAEQCDDLFDYGKCHLGEDRWLTHLFMIGAKERYQIQMNTGAFCKTEAVQDFATLLKQRRRWFLGFITNEVCMLTDWRLWKRYPILCLLRFAQNTIRTTALLFFIMVISLLTSSQRIQQLPVGFIAVSLGLNWLLMLYFGAKLGRYKIWLYPLMFVVNPFFNWLYMVYGIFTAGQRTWGGPRADAGKADDKTTAQEAIEFAEEEGDDLNIVPESFKPAADIRRRRSGRAGRPQQVPVIPSDHLEGRFAPAERTPSGWYNQVNDSGITLADGRPINPNTPYYARSSVDSFITTGSTSNSIYMPRRVESFMPMEDAAMYHINQQAQRPAGGSHFEHRRRRARSRSLGSEPKENILNTEFGDLESPSRFGFEGEEAEPKSRGYFRESVESLDLHPGYRRPPLSQSGSYFGNEASVPSTGYAGQSPPPSPPVLQHTPSTLPKLNPNALSIPQDAYRRTGERSFHSTQRSARSPLSRRSFLRTSESLPMPEVEMQSRDNMLTRDEAPPLSQQRQRRASASASALQVQTRFSSAPNAPASPLFSQPNTTDFDTRRQDLDLAEAREREHRMAREEEEKDKKRRRLTKDG